MAFPEAVSQGGVGGGGICNPTVQRPQAPPIKTGYLEAIKKKREEKQRKDEEEASKFLGPRKAAMEAQEKRLHAWAENAQEGASTSRGAASQPAGGSRCRDDGSAWDVAVKRKRHSNRVQHDVLGASAVNEEDEADQGMCLSMHQPWASMLIYGVKLVEGRNWNTEYRGRLWIASTQQEPDMEMVRSMVEQSKLLGRDVSKLPKSYPTGCLLGSVDLVDVITKEEYEAQTPEELRELESDYCFVVQNRRPTTTRIQIRGEPMLYHLDAATLKRAQMSVNAGFEVY